MIQQIGYFTGSVVKRFKTGYSNGYENVRIRKPVKRPSKFTILKTILTNLKGA
jgi:hypothetical protein